MENKIEKHIPKYRFKDFEDAWAQCKLGDLANIKTGSSDAKDAIEDGKFPFFVRSEKIEKSNKWIFDGEAILVPGEGKLGDVYHYINGKFDYHQRVYKISDFVDSIAYGKYILYYMQTKFKAHALKFTVKATVDSLRLPTLNNFSIFLPEFSEQIKVGDLFAALDKTISKYETKLEVLKQIKKLLLSDTFPRQKNLNPTIRFKNFNDDWEQRRLLNCINVNSGRDYKHLIDGDIPVYGTGGYMLSVNQALSYDQNAIGIGRKGTIDKPFLLKAPFWTVDTLFYVTSKKNIYLLFLLFLFQRIHWQKFDESTGVPSLSKSSIANIRCFFPEFKEQKQIADFLIALDKLITLHE